MKENDSWFEISPDIKVDTLGFIQTANTHPSRTGVPYWVLVLLSKGKRTLYANGKELRIGAREFFLLPPYTRQEPLDVDDHTACYIHFFAKWEVVPPPIRIDAARLILPMYGYLPPDLDCFAHLRYLCDHAISPYASPTFLATQLYAILSVISLQCQKNPTPLRKKSFINGEAYLTFIKENACRSLRAEHYENAFGMSYQCRLDRLAVSLKISATTKYIG